MSDHDDIVTAGDPDRTVHLDTLDLTPPQRERAERLLTVRRGLDGQAVVDAAQMEDLWEWIVDGEPPAEARQ